MAKHVLKAGWRFPLYEISYMVLGGALVAGGMMMKDNLLSFTTPQAATTGAPNTAEVVPDETPRESAAQVSVASEENKMVAAPVAMPNPKPAQPALPTIKRASSKKGYTFQIGVYSNKDGAANHAKQLNELGLTATISNRTVKEKSLHFVYVEHFDTREAALKYQPTLNSKTGLKSVLIAIE